MPDLEPLRVPYCRACLAGLEAKQSLTTRGLIAANVWIWGSLAGAAVVGLAPAALALAPVAALIYVPSWLRLRGSSVKGSAVEALWYRRRTYLFSFSNEEYARAFREANLEMLTEEAR